MITGVVSVSCAKGSREMIGKTVPILESTSTGLLQGDSKNRVTVKLGMQYIEFWPL